MARAIYTPEAEQDILEISQYIARDNLPAALAWVAQLRSICDLLATQPAMGAWVGTIHLGKVRRHVVGNYMIYYDPLSDGIYVVRIMHGAREQI